MTRWLPYELHTHSVHSDARFEVRELVQAIKSAGFSGVALTDHNATSGQEELMSACREYGIIGVHGTEWTTYYGHMLVLGENGCTDWRDYSKENIDDGIKKIHENQGIVGIAHPFALSDPLSTGYHWEFNVKDYSLIDYIEVWSREFATNSVQSKKAFEMWENLLLQGYHIAATSGRDWHSKEEPKKNYSYTYLGIHGEESEDTILEALKKGRGYVTTGPKLSITINDDEEKIYEPGDLASRKNLTFRINIDTKEDFDGYQQFEIEPKSIRVINNGEIIYSKSLEILNEFTILPDVGYIRIEILGKYQGKENSRILFTNPIYIEG